jgi:hypothetical protein
VASRWNPKATSARRRMDISTKNCDYYVII